MTIRHVPNTIGAIPSHRAALRQSVALVPEDRRQQGLFMPASISRNVAVTVLDKIRRAGLIRSRDESAVAKGWSDRLQLKHQGLDEPVDRLSGGNQQKVVLSKWLATDPKLLVIDEPTRGIDVGTKAEVHRLLSELAVQGLAILLLGLLVFMWMMRSTPGVPASAASIRLMLSGPAASPSSRLFVSTARVMATRTSRMMKIPLAIATLSRRKRRQTSSQ